MTHTKQPERHTESECMHRRSSLQVTHTKVSTCTHTHTHARTHTSVSLSIPTSVKEAQTRSPMLREEPMEKNVKYTMRLRTHIERGERGADNGQHR